MHKLQLIEIDVDNIPEDDISCDSDVDNRETTISISDTIRDLAVGYCVGYCMHVANYYLYLCLKLEEIWSSSSDDEDHAVKENEKSPSAASRPIWQLLFFLLMWQSVYRVSNAALNTLLKFLVHFVRLFGQAFTTGDESIPCTISNAHNFLWKTNHDAFIMYVVCPKCDSIYEYDDCIVFSEGRKKSKNCRHIAYPNHPHPLRRQECGTKLLKTVKSGRSYKLVSIKEYPYQPLHKSFSYLAKKDGFLNNCEHWRDRMSSMPQSYLGDIYDGRVWREFTSSSAGEFLVSPQCYLLTLNVDWFQPFIHTQYSVGAIYLTVQNLPRNQRYKDENIILVGIIPGPSEPSLTMNSYLAPLVQELKQAWDTGLIVKTASNLSITIRLALSCIACDIPASRKVCGFLGHNATYGCNKCYKKFQYHVRGGMDYSGYNREEWTLRDCNLHRQHCRQILNETTKTNIRKKESEFGVRYSLLLSLPYFNPVRYTVVDVMHNLFLGTGKHVFKLWLKLEVLTLDNLEEVDRRCKSFQVPHSIGRLPINIASNYGSFKASQWQTWITTYSPVVLKGIIPDIHLQCWLLFVRACNILSKRILKPDDVATADTFLLQFCRRFERLYGNENCTPNLHLHLHLKDCLLDYGPSHSFWCFSFERFNGLLGSFHTNRKSVEVQIMRKFVNNQRLRSETALAEAQFLSLLPSQESTSIPMTYLSVDENQIQKMLQYSTSRLTSIQSFENCGMVTLLAPLHEDIFDSEEVQQLELLYKQLYPHSVVARVSPFYIRSGRAALCNQVIGSVMNATSCNSSSVIMAYWPSRGNVLSNIDYSRMKVGRVQYFIRHQAVLYDSESDSNINESEHVFAYVSWKQNHPHLDWFGISATVCLDMNETFSMCSFLPVQRVHAVCAHSILDVEINGLKENVFIAVPIPMKFSL